MRRNRKRPHIEDFPDENEETFINNSDYYDKSPILDEKDEEEEPEDSHSGNKSYSTILSESHSNNPFVNQEEITDGKDTSIIKEEVNTQTILTPHQLHVDDDLSFKHQQSDIKLQSPSRRRIEQSQPNSAHNDEPRLVINELVMTNFKSYHGRQVIGPFNASFSAVVGPNGSGKSNVIDSMLFVFGFRASKMRQGKLSELIHNSSNEKLDFCQVDIHFHYVIDNDETGKADIVPDSELIISRKAFRNNSSQYYINFKASSYTEVTQLLKGKGIDLDHKRFLILQGEVESIAQMKPKADKENDDGLLEYLEDIIGTSKLKPLIENNLTKVDELNDVCLEKETRFELVEKDKDSLEEKKNEALEFLKLEKKLIDKKSIRFQTEISEYNTTREVHLEKRDVLQDELNEEKQKNQDLNKEVDEINSELLKLKNFASELKETKQQLIKQQKFLNKSSVSIEEKMKNLLNKSKKANKTAESSKSIISSSQIKLDANAISFEQYKNELEQATKNLELEKTKLDEIRKSLTEKTSEFRAKISELQASLEPWNDKLKEKDGLISLITSEIKILQEKGASSERELNEAKQKLAKIKMEGKKKENEFREVKDELESITAQIKFLEESKNLQNDELQKRKIDVSNLRQRTQEAINSFSNSQNRNVVLMNLLRLAKSGRITGFHGRLGDLGTIEDKYDIAISTAAPGLDSMVVDTVETAQSCIEYLRKNKLGYANFICLNKLRKFNLDPISTPGNPATVKRLYDLIVPTDQKFAPAFYSKVYNTLVASNLQEAKSVAFGAKRWKVVTLDGKVVDTSGTMSGGGRYVSKGAMKLASSKSSLSDVTEDEVRSLREELSQKENKLNLLDREFKESERKLRDLKERKPQLEFKVSSSQMDIEALLAEQKEVRTHCKTLITQVENNSANSEIADQIAIKEKEKNTLESDRNQIRSQMTDFETQIKNYENMILEAGGVELRLQNSKVDSNKQKIEILNEKINHEKLSNRKLENEIKRHTKLYEEASNEKEECEKELEKIKLMQEENENKLNELKGKIDEIELKLDANNEEMESIANQLEEKKTQINDLKSAEIEIEENIEKHNNIIAKCDHKIKSSSEKLSSLVVRDVEPYIEWLDEQQRVEYNGSNITRLSQEELENINLSKVAEEIEELEVYMNNVKVDIEVLKEYGKKKHEYESRRSDLNHAVEERDNIKNYCEDLKRKRLDEFMEGFNTISMSLKEMYQMITMGGNAELELVDSLDPFSEGILFSVMPPKKSWRNISNLSGGEKTLSSLALVFALHKYKPTPLYVMDEIDAALDFRNVSIVANYIKERTKNAQFVVISLRNNMFELAQSLVGIYKVNNKTKSISMNNVDLIATK